MSQFNDVLTAWWTVLDADTALAAVLPVGKSTRVKFSTGLAQPLIIKPAQCPLLALAPEPEGSFWPPARRRRGDNLARKFAIRAIGATAGQDRSAILALADAFYDVICLDMRSAGGGLLAAQGVDDVDFEGLTFQSRPGENDLILGWMFDVTCINRFRVS